MGRITDRLTSITNTFSTYSIGTAPTNAEYAALNPQYTTTQLRRTFENVRRAYNRGVINARAANVAPSVLNAIGTQTGVRASGFSFTVPENTFADLQPVLNATATIQGRRYVVVTLGGTPTNYGSIGGEATIGTYFTKNATAATGTGTVRVADRLTYTATLQSGAALSTIGLAFNPTTRAFSGTATTAASHLLRVTATDPFGAFANADFTYTATAS